MLNCTLEPIYMISFRTGNVRSQQGKRRNDHFLGPSQRVLPKRNTMWATCVILNFLAATFSKGGNRFNDISYLTQQIQNVTSVSYNRYKSYCDTLRLFFFFSLSLWNLMFLLHLQYILVQTMLISWAQGPVWLVAASTDSPVLSIALRGHLMLSDLLYLRCTSPMSFK